MTKTTQAVHKEIWLNHEHMAYCEPFNKDYDYTNIMTTNSDVFVTCSDCNKLIALQVDITSDLISKV